MAKDRYYGSGVENALFMLSRGTCYEPTCKERVLKMTSTATPRVNVQIAHIRALGRNEARFEEDYPRDQLNKFANLILLCAAHHTEVDSELWKTHYPKQVLLDWKLDREGDLSVTLRELPPLTDNILQELMTNAIENMRLEIIQAIDELKGMNKETLTTLKMLVSESFNRPYLSEDAIASLEYSARIFARLEDQTFMLQDSARGIRSLEDYGWMLAESARDLRHMPEIIPTLRESAEVFRHMHDHVKPLREAVDLLESNRRSINHLHDAVTLIVNTRMDQMASRVQEMGATAERFVSAAGNVAGLQGTTQSLERVSRSLTRLDEVANRLIASGQPGDTGRPMKYFWGGVSSSAAVLILILVLWTIATN